jgi:hypothetical protein
LCELCLIFNIPGCNALELTKLARSYSDEYNKYVSNKDNKLQEVQFVNENALSSLLNNIVPHLINESAEREDRENASSSKTPRKNINSHSEIINCIRDFAKNIVSNISKELYESVNSSIEIKFENASKIMTNGIFNIQILYMLLFVNKLGLMLLESNKQAYE